MFSVQQTSDIIEALANFFFLPLIVNETNTDVFPVKSDLLLHVSNKNILLIFFVKQLYKGFVGDVAALRPVQRDATTRINMGRNLTVVTYYLLRFHVVSDITVIISTAHKVPHANPIEVTSGEEHKVEGLAHETAGSDGENSVHHRQTEPSQLRTYLYLRHEVSIPGEALVPALHVRQTLKTVVHVTETLHRVSQIVRVTEVEGVCRKGLVEKRA